MTALVDANVWLPILVERHAHHTKATAWWEAQPAATCYWCRAIQQTVLRLLTNQAVMGKDTMNPDEAWLTWEKLVLDERAAFLLLEPSGIDSTWKRNIVNRAPTPKLWMDAYLAAWADTAGLAFVTFDAGFRSFRLNSLKILTPE